MAGLVTVEVGVAGASRWLKLEGWNLGSVMCIFLDACRPCGGGLARDDW